MADGTDHQAAEKDYESKFNRVSSDGKFRTASEDSSLKDQEAHPDEAWKDGAKSKSKTEQDAKITKNPKKPSKARFGWVGRQAGKLRSGSAFMFVITFLLMSVVYTSTLAPNIILVNLKDMYSSDLSDTSVALMDYYWKMLNFKIGPMSGQDCGDANGNDAANPEGTIKCKLSTMSRGMKENFEKQGFLVLGTKVTNDKRDQGDGNDNGPQPESRYKVMGILPPVYKNILNNAKTSAQNILTSFSSDQFMTKAFETVFSDIDSANKPADSDTLNQMYQDTLNNPNAADSGGSDAQGQSDRLDSLKGIDSGSNTNTDGNVVINTDTSKNVLSQVPQSSLQKLSDLIMNNLNKGGVPLVETPQSIQDTLQYMPIFNGDMLWLYAQLSLTAKDQVYGVFNPLTSFFHDKKFSSRIKQRYALSKGLSIGGSTDAAVMQSFTKYLTGGSGEGIDPFSGLPNADGGAGLGALANPSSILSYNTAMDNMILPATSYGGLQCIWYAFGKQVLSNAETAKAHTIARFAFQYLAAADKIKAGSTGEGEVINFLSANLQQNSLGGYVGGGNPITGNAMDDFMYKSITYQNLPMPSPFGLVYYLDTFDLLGFMAAPFMAISSSADAVGQASNIQGSLGAPLLQDTSGTERDYCLGAETLLSHQYIKGTPDLNGHKSCDAAITASGPAGFSGLLEPALNVAWETCEPPHQAEDDPSGNHKHGEDLTQPALKATAAITSNFVATLFSAASTGFGLANTVLINGLLKGVPASNVIFAGTGEILGDMAMSRGMMPSNALQMFMYLVKEKSVTSEMDNLAKYQAQKNPFDIYNKFSFMGAITHSLSPYYSEGAPGFAAITNLASVFGNSFKSLFTNANAMLYIQPDPFNPIRLAMCPDVKYWAIMITADVACNVRYSVGFQELMAMPSNVLDYMLKEHTDLTQDNVNELTERLAQTDPEGDAAQVARMLAQAEQGMNSAQIDKKTGAAMPNTEYQKFLTYCVNRVNKWGRTGVVTITPKQLAVLKNAASLKGMQGIDSEAVNQLIKMAGVQSILTVPAVSEGAKADQDWYTGKKCTENSEELTNFRAYTLMCSVDGSLAGTDDCTGEDSSQVNYSDAFYTANNILFVSSN